MRGSLRRYLVGSLGDHLSITEPTRIDAESYR